MTGWSPWCYIPSFVEIGLPVLEKIFEGFYHIWACDPDAANKLSSPLPKEAPHKIWLWLAKWFGRRSFSIVDGRRRTDAGPWVSYKLTYGLRWAKKLVFVSLKCRNANFCCKIQVHLNIQTQCNDPSFSERHHGLHCFCSACYFICVFWRHCFMLEPINSNFRVVSSKLYYGVLIFRYFLNEPRSEKTCLPVSDQVQHNSCTTIENG